MSIGRSSAIAPFVAALCLFLAGCATADFEAPVGTPAATIEEGTERLGRGELRRIEGLPFITLRGGREEMGYQYGVLLGPELRAAFREVGALKRDIRSYLWYLGPIIDWAFFDPLIADMERRIPEEYRAELRGISKGSGIPYRELLFASGGMGTLEIGCTSIAARRGDQVLHGRNLDWAPAWLGRMPVVVRYESEGGRASLVVSALALPTVALTGLNDAGISVSLNVVSYDRDKRAKPVPIWFQLRRILETASSLSDLDAALEGYRTDIGWLVTAVSAVESSSAIFELSTRGVARRDPVGDRSLYALNGYADPALGAALTPVTISTNVAIDDRARYQDLYASETGALDAEAMWRWLSDDEYVGYDGWVGFESRCHSGTIQTAVMDGAAGRLYVASEAGFAGWSSVFAFGLRDGAASTWRPASRKATDPRFAKLLDLNATYFQDLYAGKHRALYEGLSDAVGGTGWAIAAQLLSQIALRFPRELDPAPAIAALETCRSAYPKCGEFPLGLAKMALAARDYPRAEANAREALDAEILYRDEELKALEILADLANRRRDKTARIEYASRSLDLLSSLAPTGVFTGQAAKLKAKMEGYAGRKMAASRP